MRGWASRTLPDFTFTCKLPWEITHEHRCVDAVDVLHAFADRLRELGPRLGPMLIQCGPDFPPIEIDAFAAFRSPMCGGVRLSSLDGARPGHRGAA